MRLGRSVLAGLVAGAAAGFLVALLRPRGTHPAASTAPGQFPGDHLAPLTEPAPRDVPTAQGTPTHDTPGPDTPGVGTAGRRGPETPTRDDAPAAVDPAVARLDSVRAQD